MSMYNLIEYSDIYSKHLNVYDNITEMNVVEIVLPLKHLSNFWRTLEMLLIICEINFSLAWYADCVI